MRSVSKLWASLALVLGLAALASAQEAPSPAGEPQAAAESADEGVFFETVDVNVVNVQVFVTDKKGNPITGLGIDDFELFEDKKPVKISNFYAVEGRQPVAETAESALSTDSTPPEELERIAEDERLHLVVYIDNFNIRPFNRNRVFRRLREFLSQKLGPGDRVMLVTFDRSLNYRHPFTSNPDLIASALFVANGVLVGLIYAQLAPLGPDWLRHPKVGQVVMFVAPVVMLVCQWWLFYFVSDRVSRLVRK